jgi:hypothetical protein
MIWCKFRQRTDGYNKRQFELRAIFKNNLCEESGRDPPFVELGNDILAKKEWRWHFCIWRSLARSRQKLNSRERSKEPHSFPFTSRREQPRGYMFMPSRPLRKRQARMFYERSLGIFNKYPINCNCLYFADSACFPDLSNYRIGYQLTEWAVSADSIVSYLLLLSYDLPKLHLRLRPRQLRPTRHSLEGRFHDGKGRKGRLSGKFKRRHSLDGPFHDGKGKGKNDSLESSREFIAF